MNKYIFTTVVIATLGLSLVACGSGGRDSDTFQHSFPNLPLGHCESNNAYNVKLNPSIYKAPQNGSGEANFDLIGNLLISYNEHDSESAYAFSWIGSDDPNDVWVDLPRKAGMCVLGHTNEYHAEPDRGMGSGPWDDKLMSLYNCQTKLESHTMTLNFSSNYSIESKDQYYAESPVYMRESGTFSFSCHYQLYDDNGQLIPNTKRMSLK